MTRIPLHYEPQFLESGKTICVIYDINDILLGVTFDEDSAQWLIERVNKDNFTNGE